MGLDGPFRTIIVEPQEVPAYPPEEPIEEPTPNVPQPEEVPA